MEVNLTNYKYHRLLGLLSMIFLLHISYASNYDTLFVKKGHYIIGDNFQTKAFSDTFIIQSDSIHYIVLTEEDYTKSKEFYLQLQNKAYEKKWTKRVYNLMFKHSTLAKHTDTVSYQRNTSKFIQYSGKTINTITIQKLKLYDAQAFDFNSEWVERLSKYSHLNTQNFIIKKNLLFQQGDKLDPILLAENEKIIRELNYIKDVEFLIVQDPNNEDQVKLNIVIIDKWPIAFDLQFQNAEIAALKLYNRNFLGLGQSIQFNYLLNYNKLPDLGFEGKYYTNNLFGTFTEGGFGFSHAFEDKVYDIYLNKRFLTSATKYAGGAKFTYNKLLENLSKPDTVVANQFIKYRFYDMWLARSFSLQGGSNLKSGSRFSIALTHQSYHFLNRPLASSDANYELHNRRILLSELTFSKQNFYKSRLLYGFGTTEDIPYGLKAKFAVGYENAEFFNRHYAGVGLSSANLYQVLGYLYGNIEYGTYINNGKFEQGALKLKLRHGSPLFVLKQYKFRQFFGLNYLNGFDRFQDEVIYFNQRNDIRGYRSRDVYGLQKLTLNFESVAFSPYYIYDFRFVFFTFADIGFMGNNDSFILNKNQLYSSIGIGFRARNDNLAFNTFSVHFSFFPNVPNDINISNLVVSGEKLLRPDDFEVRKPEIIRYE